MSEATKIGHLRLELSAILHERLRAAAQRKGMGKKTYLRGALLAQLARDERETSNPKRTA